MTAFTNKFDAHVHPSSPQSYDEVLDRDGTSSHSPLRLRGSQDVGPRKVPTEWYLSREIHEREVESIWKKAWQVAGWAGDIPKPGDTLIYDVASISLVVVRTEEGSIKAYYNSCPHRSVTLRPCGGRVANLQCPFHGFTWSLSGKLIQIPCPEQFTHIDPEEYDLPEVQVEIWQGFIFVNMDPKAAPLSDFLGSFPSELINSPYGDRTKIVHLKKILPANWKAAQEAFMDGWHTLTTHPQQALCSSIIVSQHDAFENYSRGILPFGFPNEYMKRTPSQQEMLILRSGMWEDDDDLPSLAEGETARHAYANQARAAARRLFGDDFADRLEVSELVDTIYFTLYPNFHPFGSPLHPQVNIFRPYGDDHTRCEWEIMMFDTSTHEEDAPILEPKIIGEDQDFSVVPEIGFMAPFLNQDISNLGQIMKGMRNNRKREVFFAEKHELQIRHFYARYIEAMNLQ